MKELSDRLVHRFVKDFGLPFPIESKELLDYYIELFDREFMTKKKLQMFKDMIKDFDSEEDFYQYRNGIICQVLEFIENQESYKEFNQRDISKLEYPLSGDNTLKNRSIYSLENSGKIFLSIDLRSANFTVLKNIDRELVKKKNSYIEFISEFTDYDYFKFSKNLRQSMLGKLNSKRIAKYAKWLLENKYILPIIENRILDRGQIVSYNYDEFLFEVDKGFDFYKIGEILLNTNDLNIKKFLLVKISDKYSYFVKEFFTDLEDFELRKYVELVEFKGVDKSVFPQIFKRYFNLSIEERDLYFTSSLGIPAKYLEPIELD